LNALLRELEVRETLEAKLNEVVSLSFPSLESECSTPYIDVKSWGASSPSQACQPR